MTKNEKKNVEQSKSGPVLSEKAVQVGASRKDLWKRWVLSLKWNSECVIEGESGEEVGGELDSVTLSAGCFVQGWRNETGRWRGHIYCRFV